MVAFQSTNCGKTGIDNDKLEAMRASLRGSLLMPADEGYDVSRTLWNAMIDRHPAAIVRAAGAGAVMQAVNFARENKLLLAVRGGGHNIAGKAACDGGLMLDLSAMKSVRVDPAAKRARVELRELHARGRNPARGSRRLRLQLRAACSAESQIRPDQPVQPESEHRAESLRLASRMPGGPVS